MRWFRALSLVALIVVPVVASAGDLEDGRKLLADGNYAAAAEKFRAVTSADVKSFDGWLGLAEAELGMGNPLALIEAAEYARDLDKKSAVAWVLAGRGYYMQGDAIAGAGGSGSTIRLFYADAKRCGDRALGIDPKCKGANYILAKAALGDTDDPESLTKGIAYYEAETGLAPENSDAWYQLGLNLFNGARAYERAAKAFGGCVKADPTHQLGWKWYGSSLEYTKKPDEAVAAYATAIQLNPADGYAIQRLAAGKPAVAIKALEAVLKELGKPTPETCHPFRMLGWLYGRAERHDEAIKHLKGLAAKFPKDTTTLTYLGDAYKAKGDRGEALKTWKRAVELNPTATEYAWKQVWAATPSDPATWEWLFNQRPDASLANNLGLHHRDTTRDYKKSLEWYVKASELAPNDAAILNDTGLIFHYHFRKFAKAIEYYDRAIAAAQVQFANEIAAGAVPIPLRDARNNKRLAEQRDARDR